MRLVEDHAHGPDVGPPVHVALAERLLGRHVPGRADESSRRRHRGLGRIVGLEQLRDAEVEHLGDRRAALVGEKDVVGLEVAVHDAAGVRGADRGDDGREQVRRLLEAHGACARKVARERLAAKERHRQDGRTVSQLEHVEHVDDVRMRERRGGARLAQQALSHRGPRVERRVEELDRDGPPRVHLRRFPHLAHASFADERPQAVAVGEEDAGRDGPVARRRGRNVGVAGAACPLHPASEPRSRRSARDHSEQLVAANGLHDVLERAVLHGAHGGLQRGRAGHEHHGDLDAPLAKELEQIDPAEPRHVDVADDDVEGPALDQLGGGRAVGTRGHGVARCAQHAARRAQDRGLVVDDEHRELRNGLHVVAQTVAGPAVRARISHEVPRSPRLARRRAPRGPWRSTSRG